MKKELAIIFVLFFFCSSAVASPCALPKANTEKDISFLDFEWYADYQTTKTHAEQSFFSGSHDDFNRGGFYYTPHWSIVKAEHPASAGSEVNCGGELYFSNVPDVAGYKVFLSCLSFLFTPDYGTYDNYKDADALQFYAASYEFIVEDKKLVFSDLVEKLKSIYGNDPYTDAVYDGASGVVCAYWINKEGAAVGVNYNTIFDDLMLYYVAPSSEEKLAETEKWVETLERGYANKEVENAAGNTSGL